MHILTAVNHSAATQPPMIHRVTRFRLVLQRHRTRGLANPAHGPHAGVVRGRRYRAVVEMAYLSGALPDDERDALRAAVHAGIPEASLTVATEPYAVARVTATVRADNPLGAVSELSTVLDRALMSTGLFEAFDATGRVLRVAPLERAAVIDAD
jgi:hypothetical protein